MNRKQGFTLIELLVVIAIIGILSSVVLASLNSARQKSRDAKRISDLKQLQLALELAFDSASPNAYPAAISTTALVDPGYIATIPTPPGGTSQTAYSYELIGTTDYVLMATLEDGSHSVLIGADIDGSVGSATNCGTESSGTETPANYCVQP